MLLAVAIALVAVDLVTTLVGVRLVGPDGETNPFHRAALRRGGPALFAVIYLACTAGLLTFAYWFDVVLSVIAVFVLVAVNNTYWLLRAWRSPRRRGRP